MVWNACVETCMLGTESAMVAASESNSNKKRNRPGDLEQHHLDERKDGNGRANMSPVRYCLKRAVHATLTFCGCSQLKLIEDSRAHWQLHRLWVKYP